MKEEITSDYIVTNPVDLNEIPTMLETGKSKKEKKKALKKVRKEIRTESQGNFLFCDSGDILHGTINETTFEWENL
jgi:transcription initiation factor IIE alpha subunit